MKIRLLTIALAVAAAAHDSANGMNLSAQLSFLPGWRHADEAEEFHISGIRMSLDEGWKTYWRIPGEGGIGPQLEIESSRNLRAMELLFPGPKVFEQNDMLIIGYDEEVLFPIKFYPDNNELPIRFDASFYAGICEEVCIPVSYKISASLEPPGKVDEEILGAMSRIPEEWNASGGAPIECNFEFTDSGLFAKARMPIPNSLGPDHVVFEYAENWIRFGSPQVKRPENGTLVATSPIYFGAREDLKLDSSKLRITVLTRKKTIDINGCVSS